MRNSYFGGTHALPEDLIRQKCFIKTLHFIIKIPGFIIITGEFSGQLFLG